MKNVKRLLCLIMVAMVMVAVVPSTSEAAAKVKLNKKKITLTITNKKKNPSVTLKVKGVSKKTAKKANWSTSNKKVATVKKGKVTAKKAGKAVITCKVKGKKYTCEVIVKDNRKENNSKTTKCNHRWAELWECYKTDGYYTGEIYPCMCGKVFSSQDEYDKHVSQIFAQRNLEKQTGCSERILETGIHGTRSYYTPSITTENGITHVVSETCYIEYLYCVYCGEKLSIAWDVPEQ